MKIKSINISNILSFGDFENIDEATGLVFDTSGTEGGLHILIGPNGSGKSNFVEVLNQVFKKALFQTFIFDERPVKQNAKTPLQPSELLRVVTVQPKETLNLEKNRNTTPDLQMIRLVLELNQNDFGNLEFLIQNRSAIDSLRMKYTQQIPATEPTDIDVINGYADVPIELVKNNNVNDFSLSFPTHPPQLLQHYLMYFDGFQYLIRLHNEYEKSVGEQEWKPLRRTFALLGSYRNYNAMNSAITIDPNRAEREKNICARIRAETTRASDGGEPAVFELVKTKLAYRFFEHLRQGGLEFAKAQIREEDPYASINTLIKNYLSLNLNVDAPEVEQLLLNLYLEDGQGKRIETYQLSSGEKGILHFIFSIYGYDLENGVMVIDEPELHLHPQMQKQYLQVIEQTKRQFDLQFIIATHSPQFTDKDTIKDVYRFYSDERMRTRVKNPAIEEDQKSLAKILDYTNSSKIFFVSKAILVEGETDEFFFRFYLDWMKNQPDHPNHAWRGNIRDFEILNIKGKGQRELWTNFLGKFGLSVYFIGDWDNVTEIADFDISQFDVAYHSAEAAAGREVSKKGSSDGRNLFETIGAVLAEPSLDNLRGLTEVRDYIIGRQIDYSAIVQCIKNDHQDQWVALERSIEASYEQGILILKRGELENYLGTAGKGLDTIIGFCENDFEAWLVDPRFDEGRAELEVLFRKVFEKSPEARPDC